jgi:hypothetical protein
LEALIEVISLLASVPTNTMIAIEKAQILILKKKLSTLNSVLRTTK